MLKPLSKKSLEKRYAELGLSAEKLDALHRYFKAFANLYGNIPIKFAWDIFKKYEGISFVHKKDFIAFSGVAQRDADLPYYIIEDNEIYSDGGQMPEWRMIVNKELVLHGYNKFINIYDLDEKRNGHTLFVPEKEELLSFEEDRFYKTKAGKEISEFICSLKTTGKGTFYKEKKYEILDINGQSTHGKRLDSFTMITDDEQFEIDYAKSETTKNTLRQEYTAIASEKVLKRIKSDILIGSIYRDNSLMTDSLEMLNNVFGVSLTKMQAEKYIKLFSELNNTSNMWRMFGWSPTELSKKYGTKRPSAISIGDNMKKLIEKGELDEKELRKELAKLGIDMIM